MDKSVPANLPDGAFERFLTSAIATILTLIFSWRFLLEADDINRTTQEETAHEKRGYMEAGELDDDTRPYSARASTASCLAVNKRNDLEGDINTSSVLNTEAQLYRRSGVRSQAVAGAEGRILTGTLTRHSVRRDEESSLGEQAVPALTEENLTSEGAVTDSDPYLGICDETSNTQTSDMQTRDAPANGRPAHGKLVDGSVDTNSPTTTQAHLATGASTEPVQVAAPVRGSQYTTESDSADVKPGYFRPKLPLKWLDDNFEDDDVFIGDSTDDNAKPFHGDLAELSSSIPPNKLKQFEKFLASENLSENQLGAKLLEQYLLHEAHCDDSSESDYCDFNRTLDTITEEDTSDFDSTDTEGSISAGDIKRSSVYHKDDQQEKREYLEGYGASSPGKRPLSPASSMEENTGTNGAMQETKMTLDSRTSSSDSGSIDVRIDIDETADSPHRYAQIKPQRALIIGPYQDRDSAFSQEHFIDTGTRLEDKHRGIIGDKGGDADDKAGTPGRGQPAAAGETATLNATPASISRTGDNTVCAVPAAANPPAACGSDANAADSLTRAGENHITRVNEVETAGPCATENDVINLEGQRESRPLGNNVPDDQGVTDKSIIHENMDVLEQRTNAGQTSHSAYLQSDNLREFTQAQGELGGNSECAVTMRGSGLHNEVNREHAATPMDDNTQVKVLPIPVEHTECMTASMSGSRPWETASDSNRHLNQVGKGRPQEGVLNCDKLPGKIVTLPSSSLTGDKTHRRINDISGVEEEYFKDTPTGSLATGAHRFALANDQVIISSGSANKRTVDCAKGILSDHTQSVHDASGLPKNYKTTTAPGSRGLSTVVENTCSVKEESNQGKHFIRDNDSSLSRERRAADSTFALRSVDTVPSGKSDGDVATATATKEFASGTDSPKKWIFTSVKNKYTFEIPSSGNDGCGQTDEHALVYHSAGEHLGLPSNEKPTGTHIKRKAIGFKDINRAIKDPYPISINAVRTEDYNTSPQSIFDRRTSGKLPPPIDTYRFYHNKIDVPFNTSVPLVTSSGSPSEGHISNSPAIQGQARRDSPPEKIPQFYDSVSENRNSYQAVVVEKTGPSTGSPSAFGSGKQDLNGFKAKCSDSPNAKSAILPDTSDVSDLKLVGARSKSCNAPECKPSNLTVCTAIATSTALAKRDPTSSDDTLDVTQGTAVSAVARAEASGANPYIAIGRASARAATAATASAAHSVVTKGPESDKSHGDIAVVISTSCKLRGKNKEIEQDAEGVIQSLSSNLISVQQRKGAIMDAATQSSPDLQEKRRKFRVTIEQPDTSASSKETRTIEFELPPGTDASQFSLLITNAVKKIMDDSAYSTPSNLTEQEKFDEAVQNVAREVMQVYTSQSSQPQAIQVKRRKKNKNCFYVRGISKSTTGKQKVLGVYRDEGNAQSQSPPSKKHGTSAIKSRKQSPKGSISNEIKQFNNNNLSSEKSKESELYQSRSPPTTNTSLIGNTKLKGILKKSTSESVSEANLDDNGDISATREENVFAENPPSSPRYDDPLRGPLHGYRHLSATDDLEPEQRPKPSDIILGKQAWPPSKTASLPYNWRQGLDSKEKVKKEYKSVLQDPVPHASKTPIAQLRKYQPPEKLASETRNRLLESRRGYFNEDKERSKSTSELDAEFDARKESDGPGGNFVLVDIDLNVPPSKPTKPKKIEKLKRRIMSARPKAPQASYVEKVWNAKELISKSHEKGLDRVRDYTLDDQPCLSPSQASSIEHLRRSKSLGLLPRTFFSNNQTYSYNETDLDSAEYENKTLETNIDEHSEKSKSMGNLQEDEVFPSDGLDKHKSTGDALDESPEQNKSAHELRVSKSLGKLNVPSWYTNSHRPKQEIVILSNARDRDLPFADPNPWRKRPVDTRREDDASMRPVVIQHRVRSPMRSPANSVPNTPKYDVSFDTFELPSTRIKRNSPQYRTMPIRPYQQVARPAAQEYFQKHPAKDAYLDLKEELAQPRLERGMKSYKSLPANVQLANQSWNFSKETKAETETCTPAMDNRQEITIRNGGLQVNKAGAETEPTVQRYSHQAQLSPTVQAQHDKTSVKHRKPRKKKKNKEPETTIDSQVPVEQARHHTVNEDTSFQSQPHSHGSGSAYERYSDAIPPSQQHVDPQLSLDELNERNRIIDGEEAMRYGYTGLLQYAHPVPPTYFEDPSMSPLQTNPAIDGDAMPPLVHDHQQSGPVYYNQMRESEPIYHNQMGESEPMYYNQTHESQRRQSGGGSQWQTPNAGQIYPSSPHEMSRNADPLDHAFYLLRRAAEESMRSLNVSMVSNMSFDVEMLGDDNGYFPPISDNKTNIVVSSFGEETVFVKCRNHKCGKSVELEEARKTYKTCHNCYTYYCSRECRKANWEKHKKRCLFSKVNTICKYTIKKIHDDDNLTAQFTRVAREGYSLKGRGCVLLVFSSHITAEEFVTRGMDCEEAQPVYCSMEELEEVSNSLGEHFFELSEMCGTYNPGIKFVLDVVIVASSGGESVMRAPRRDGVSVKKCTKLRLSSNQAVQSSPYDDPETLILTAMPGKKSVSDKKAREKCFLNIQKLLRKRGVSLRHHYPDVYAKLCAYVEDNERFTPVTIYPINEDTGKPFMCLIMPDSDPDPRLLGRAGGGNRGIGLTTEL